MPTYTYKCEKCEKTFDKFESMSAEPLKVCIDENCKGDVKRLIGMGAGAILKGTGYYQTDFKNKPAAKKAECQGCPSAGACASTSSANEKAS
ncbi:MAG: zinc ribbon domain-containing protein [Chitinivibrionia bacterium]|nr:zinc ribbon domain-containing protein [Chitinivibrionia bacterium]